jgi:hypothetical protein
MIAAERRKRYPYGSGRTSTDSTVKSLIKMQEPASQRRWFGNRIPVLLAKHELKPETLHRLCRGGANLD